MSVRPDCLTCPGCRPLLPALFALLLLLFAGRQAVASMWVDPAFEDMAEEASLIVHARIVKGGPFFARARVIETLKGKPPTGDFVVTGYNNPYWPPEGQELESLADGEQYLFFLRKQDAANYKQGPGPGLPAGWSGLPLFAVPTPTAGDYVVKDGALFGGWRWAPRGGQGPSTPTKLVFPLVRAVALRSDPVELAAARALLRKSLTVVLVEQAAKEPESGATATRIDWLLNVQALLGDATATEAVLAANRLPPPNLRLAAAAALKSLSPSPDVMKVVEALLVADHPAIGSFLQAEAARALLKLDPEGKRAVDLIIRALPSSSPAGAGPQGLMDPVRNTRASGREVMVRALTRYRAKQAEAELVRLLKQKYDDGDGVLPALIEHFMVLPSPAARPEILRKFARARSYERARFNSYFLADGDPKTLDEAFAIMLKEEKAYNTKALFEPYALRCGRNDRRLAQAVLRLLREHRGDGELVFALPMSLSLTSGEVDKEIASINVSTLGEGGAATMKIVADARKLQQQALPDPAKRMEAWLALLARDRLIGYSGRYILREVVCTTPADVRAALLARLASGDFGSDVEVVQKALRAGGPAVTDGSIADFACPGEKAAPRLAPSWQ
jgi:hypothetical protein